VLDGKLWGLSSGSRPYRTGRRAEYLDSAFVAVVVFARSVAALSAAVDALCRRIKPAVV
jgi:hypothetical protein